MPSAPHYPITYLRKLRSHCHLAIDNDLTALKTVRSKFEGQSPAAFKAEITVPALSIFLLVRAGYELVESSTQVILAIDSPDLCFPPFGT